MLTNIGRLFDGKRSLTFNEQAIKVFLEQGLNCLREISDDLGVQIFGLVENGQRPIFEHRVGI